MGWCCGSCGWGLVHLWAGSTAAQMALPITNNLILATPSWNTNLWLTNPGPAGEPVTAGSAVSFEFSVPCPPGGRIYYGSFPSASSGTQPASNPTVTFAAEISTYSLILLPSWNTEFAVTKSVVGFTVTFSVPPPNNSAYFCWGIK